MLTDHLCTRIQAFMRSVQQNTLVPGNFATTPVHMKSNWSEVLKYCQKKKRGNVDLPLWLLYIVVYEMGGEHRLVSREDFLDKSRKCQMAQTKARDSHLYSFET